MLRRPFNRFAVSDGGREWDAQFSSLDPDAIDAAMEDSCSTHDGDVLGDHLTYPCVFFRGPSVSIQSSSHMIKSTSTPIRTAKPTAVSARKNLLISFNAGLGISFSGRVLIHRPTTRPRLQF